MRRETMRRISFAAGIAAAALVLAGCGQNIQIAETGEVTADTPASLAERYVQGLYVRSNVAAGRSVLSQEYPELLYEMELEDKDGNAVVFADLGEDEKREFAEFWEQSTVSELADKRLPLWTRRFVPPPALETRWSVRSPSPQGTTVHLRKKRKSAVQTSPAQSARART